MKIYLIIFIICLLPSFVQAENTVELNSSQRLGYALGMDIGNSIRNMNPPIDIDYLLLGIKNIYLQQKALLSPNEAFLERRKYANNSHAPSTVKKKMVSSKELIAKGKRLKQWRREKAAANAYKEEAFFKHNKKALGVVTTSSGLQYMVMHEGAGVVPVASDFVSVHYTAGTIGGKEFDNSYQRNEPVLFALRDALPGWVEVLQLMSVGSKYRVFMPAKLTYGKNGSGTLVEPGSTLIFEIELLGVVDEKTYLEETKETINKIPPYTDPSIPRTMKRKVIKKRPYISKDDVSLQTGNNAAMSFLKVLQLLMPVSSFDNVMEACKVVATKKYELKCREMLGGRVDWLKSMEGLNGADFYEGKVLADKNQPNLFHGSWKEVFSFKSGPKRVLTKELLISVVDVNGEWQVSDVEEGGI